MSDSGGRWAGVVLGTIVVALAAVSGSGQQQRPPVPNAQTPTGLPPGTQTQPSPSGLLIPVQPPPKPTPKLLEQYKAVTADRLKHPEDSDWLMVRRTYDGWGYSPLDQITTANVARLQPVWMMSTGMNNGHQAPPYVNNGVMFVSTSYNQLIAINAKTGDELWRYRSPSPADARVSKPVNRGPALFGDKVFLALGEAVLVAIDAKSGKVLWRTPVEDNKKGYYMTAAPLIADGKVIVGISGGDGPTRGFVAAYDPDTGKEVWRCFTIPAPGEPGSETWSGDIWARGGGPTWLTGTYDPALNLLYWGTGNPSPDWDGESRPGANLYTDSLVALDPDTGTLKWHFQYTPHDTHDWDANEIPVLADLTIGGRLRKTVIMANRNGFLYVNDRVTGEFILGKPFVNTTWAKEIAPDGRPRVLPGTDPSETGTVTCPDWYGGTNFMSPSYDSGRGLLFLTARETCARFTRRPPPATAGLGDRAMGGSVALVSEPKRYGALRALDPTTGERKWEITYGDAGWAGVLATAGGVVFSGDHEGNFFAADSQTGKKLFQFQTGAALFAPPTSYAIDGRQWVVIPSGATLTAFALPALGPSSSK